MRAVLAHVALILLVGTIPCRGAAQKRYEVTINSTPSGASIYLEDKAAGVQGTTPHTFTLKAGSYTFILEAEGYQSSTQTVKIGKKETFTFSLVAAPATLSVAAAAGTDLSGASVKVNGKEVGKGPLSITLQQGRYLVEVFKEGFEVYREWVDVRGGEKRGVTVGLVKSSAGTGTLLVGSNIMGAEVLVDGRQVDTAPALLEKLDPGKRIVEVRAKGYLNKQQEVAVEAGKTVKITLELQPDPQAIAAAGGTLQILASHKGVEIFVDGKSYGMAPAKVEGLAEGSHIVEARKDGLAPAEQTFAVKKGELNTIKLALKELVPPTRTGGLRVIGPILGSTVFIDGTLAGKVPLLRHQLAPGPHIVTVKNPGYEDSVQTVEVRAGEISEVRADLKPGEKVEQPAATAKKEDIAHSPSEGPRGISSYGAHLVPPASFTADVSLGFAHLFEGRLTAGIFSKTILGLDAGVEFRTYGAMSEIGLHTKFRVLRLSPLAMAMMFSLGGGGGPSSRNTAYANLGVVTSMWFRKLVTFSARAFFNFYTDRLCPEKADPSELSVCAGQRDLTTKELRARLGGTRFFLSAVIEVPVSEHLNLMALIEGVPFQGDRYAFTDRFAAIMPESDPGVYFRLGMTFKY